MYKFLLEKRRTNRLTLDLALILISLFWISRGKYFIALLLILVAGVGFYINRKKIVSISDGGILYPYFIDKNIPWSDVENVMLRDDVLTIDLTNNKLLQSTITSLDSSISETAFNDYCIKQISANRDQSLLNEKS